MEKDFWKSKTIWAGVLLCLSAAIELIATGVITNENSTRFLAGLAIVGFRDAMNG